MVVLVGDDNSSACNQIPFIAPETPLSARPVSQRQISKQLIINIKGFRTKTQVSKVNLLHKMVLDTN